MSAILDVIVAGIIFLSIFFAAKNGFFKTLIGFGSVIAAIFVVLIFSSKLQAYFISTPAAQSVREGINGRLAEMVSSSAESYNPDDVKESSEFGKLLSIVGLDEKELEEKWDTWKKGNADELRDSLVNYISEPLVNGVAWLLAFLVLFFGTIIVLKLVSFVLDRLFTLPILSQANTLLGVVLGILLAVFRVCIFCYIVNLILPYLQANNITLLSKIDPEQTFLFKFFTNFDFISKIL